MNRFEITYTPDSSESMIAPSLWVKVKNTEPIPMRAAFIAGPYLLYVDCRSENYNSHQKCFVTADQPSYDSQLQPSKSFYSELSCHTIQDSYKWTVDVVSQMIFNSTFDINFEVMVGTSKEVLQNYNASDANVKAKEDVLENRKSSVVRVRCLDTFDLWNLPVPDVSKPIHLVILTHGLHSNVGADMFYLKEQIDSCNSAERDENIVVKGYFGNICKTERGVKYLGSRVGEFIIDLLTNNKMFSDGKVTKISFIGHSLGGVVQTFAIAYLQINFPWFFEKIKPINFVTIASPMLGSNENPIYVSLALSAGIVGKTGQDLSLRYIEDNGKPLFLLLPSGPTRQVLKKFVRRTVYANTVNDGVVPLRTSALLYLDHEGLSTVLSKKGLQEHHIASSEVDKIPDDDCVEETTNASMLPQPLQMIFSKFMPQKQRVNEQDSQPINSKHEEPKHSTSRRVMRRIDGLPNSSVLETAQSLILPPLPPMSYIVNPDERKSAIIYDKVYHEKDLPPRSRKVSESGIDEDDAEVIAAMDSATTAAEISSKAEESQVTAFRKRLLSRFDVQEFERIEEEIAREYHKGMSWRKVLVRLEADAHNNIIVRRRFANAYGWPVIDHLIENHFNSPEPESRDDSGSTNWNLSGLGMMENDSAAEDPRVIEILSRDLLRKENNDIEREESKLREHEEHKWINTKDADSFFNTGPASYISDLSDIVANFRDQWYNSQGSGMPAEAVVDEMELEYEKDSELPHQVVGDFI